MRHYDRYEAAMMTLDEVIALLSSRNDTKTALDIVQRFKTTTELEWSAAR